ncbi:AAA family ATPase [Vallicoccus soli]|uniref:MoxR family ATPase n=1 Tax=Vallicoccus soli TaxID=2339232 RepID=A0A3A3YY92_9ACTN|nr:MoxR family ATPase [Vallicoccus soli]RJK96730.1 MoxR family ATPase [Vallicoccus soli]
MDSPPAGPPGPPGPPRDPAALAGALARHGYLADRGTATAAYLALRTGRPLLLEGEPGTGKTSLATALAGVLGAPSFRLQCYEGLDAAQVLYDWDFPRQLLHLRAVEAAGGAARAAEDLERSVHERRFLVARPLLQALEASRPGRPSVLLVDEVDRADDAFEAYLLEVLADAAVTVPELGTLRAEEPPVVVLTSNRTRDLHDALRRRCLYHWVEHPDPEREVAVLRLRLPEVTERLARQVAAAAGALRAAALVKPPGLAESLDWAGAVHALGAGELDAEVVEGSLGAVLKHREDRERVLRAGAPSVEDLVAAARRAG